MTRGNVKVLVMGPGEAGKSTLIAALCANAVNVEVHGRTVALDHGTLDVDGTTFHFFGVPGQGRFAAVQESLLPGAQVGVVVIRHGDRLDPLTRQWCRTLAGRGVPLVLVINSFGASDHQPEAEPQEPFLVRLELDLASRAEAARLLPVLHRLARKEG